MLILSVYRVRKKLLYLTLCLAVSAAVWFGLPWLYTTLATEDDYRTLGDPVRAEALPDTAPAAAWFDLLTTVP